MQAKHFARAEFVQAKRFAGRGICAGETFRREGNLCKRNVSPGAEFVQANLPQRRGARSLIRLFPQASDGIFGIHLQNTHALERYVGGGVVFLWIDYQNVKEKTQSYNLRVIVPYIGLFSGHLWMCSLKKSRLLKYLCRLKERTGEYCLK